MILTIIMFIIRSSIFVINQTLYVFYFKLGIETKLILILVSITLFILIIIVIAVDKYKKLNLFLFYYSERSSIENIMLNVFLFLLIDGFCLRFTQEYRAITWWKKYL